jgi:DNA-binding MarR family transcriptional regulator
MVDDVAKRTFDVLPMLKRRLLRMDAVQAEHSVPMSQVQVLTMLGETGMMTVSEISSRLGIAKPNITPLVDKLIADGYVERKRDEIDRRVVKVLLLPAGAEKLESIRETIGRHAMRWVSVVPDKDFYDLQYALETIVRVLNAVD